MQEDERCCGGGSCLIDPQGRCWCGQQWPQEPARLPVHNDAPVRSPVAAPVCAPGEPVALNGDDHIP